MVRCFELVISNHVTVGLKSLKDKGSKVLDMVCSSVAWTLNSIRRTQKRLFGQSIYHISVSKHLSHLLGNQLVLTLVSVYGKFTGFIPLIKLTLKVLVTTIDAQWEGMGDVGSARYEPALLPPCPTIRVLSYSN